MLTIPAEAATTGIAIFDAVDDLRARAGVYRLLSGVFAEEADAAFLDAIRGQESLAALSEFGLNFDADFTQSPIAVLEDSLACEYATLFASPGGAAPVESVRLTGRMQQDPFYRVQADYKRLGFAVQDGRFKTIDDHLAVELAFVASLLEQAAAAIENADEAASKRLDKEIKRFWTLHLGKWARGFGRVVARATVHSFYREMAKLLTLLGEDEVLRLKLKVDDVDGRPPEKPNPEIEGIACGLPDPPPGAPQAIVEATPELPSELA